MVLDDEQSQKPSQVGPRDGNAGEAGAPLGGGRSSSTATHGDERSGTAALMEHVAAHANLKAATKRVKQNKGSAGVDGMTVDVVDDWLTAHGEELRQQLLSGRYRPAPVRRVSIPKKDGGMRELGIPTVVDRVVQQAVLQVLQPLFDPTFSTSSHGFRPRRSAHGAILQAQQYVQEGRHVVVDVDLSKFFDRVNHDVLMGRLAKRIEDKRLLRLIRRFLEAGVMLNGVVMERHEGTPQGGPLSPLLANLLLDDVDKELERRGHAFVRYADDCNVYVRSMKAGERVMAGLRQLYERLHLKVNEEKSAVAKVTTRKFLGFSFWMYRRKAHRRVAPQALATMRDRVRSLTRRVVGRSLDDVIKDLRSYLLGWKGYFGLSEVKGPLADADQWIRHRLRALVVKQRRGGRGNTRWSATRRQTINFDLPTRFFDEKGLPRLAT
jgi:group II intron reverse transcriptase/maturase